MKIEKIHISFIKLGDTINHFDGIRTVTKSNIKSGFMGVTLFGDSYNLGTRLVERVIFENTNNI